MKIANRTVSVRTALGCLTLVAVLANTAVMADHSRTEVNLFVAMQAMNDGQRYALAMKYPSIREDLLASSGVKDIASLHARVESEYRALKADNEHLNRRLAFDFTATLGSFAVFVAAGFSLIRAGRKPRQDARAFGG